MLHNNKKYKLDYTKFRTKVFGLIFFLIILQFSTSAQGFLHTDGKNIVDGNNQNFILRGIGTGNWMLQEGYMMQSSEVAGTQHEFRQKLVETIGEERTQEFYSSWLKNGIQKIDIDSMAAWGFNSIRVALHYKWFTLPIEEEPLAGENTWIESGFMLTDSLVRWCSENQMYLILDLHGAPGGQGKNAAISDYDSNKPSLWESESNKAKTVALWKKFAERYANETWIGGYDLLNEVNWSFSNGNNSELRNLYIRITNAIREVDHNHILFIEGNWFANDFSGLTPPWDDNMVYSFHKYWTYNESNSLDWVTQLRDSYTIPLWLGEAGENSNTWFTNLVSLAEKNNIGWSWWPVKKSNINNVLNVTTNADYKALIEMWKGNGSMSSDAAYQAVMTYSENQKFENNRIQYDVIDALIRQPHSLETKAFKAHSTNEIIYAVDYDLGRNGMAYFDTDTADYHQETNNFTSWNAGWQYRNDGVDIENCTDTENTNGFSIGWIEKGEFLSYTLNSEALAAYTFNIRTASEDEAQIHIEVNGHIASPSITIPATSAWDTWKTTSVNNIILPEGKCKVKIIFESGSSNFNYFSFTDGQAVEGIPFEYLSADTPEMENEIRINLNKAITSDSQTIKTSDFQLIVNNALAPIQSFQINPANKNQIILRADQDLFCDDNIRVSYIGSSMYSDSQALESFRGQKVQNNFHEDFEIPCQIEAEDFYRNHGFQLEECSDYEGGQNTAYADDGDYLDYILYVPEAGNYKINFRFAANYGNPQILLMNSDGDRIAANKLVTFHSTGGWQNWETQSSTIELPKGKIIFRIYSRSGEHNLNWFSFDFTTNLENITKPTKMILSPNPASDAIKLSFDNTNKKHILMYNMQGVQLVSLASSKQSVTLDVKKFPLGNYIIQILSTGYTESFKIQILR